MKKILKYLLVVVVYNILGAIFWGDQQLLLPVFISLFVVINVYLLDTKQNLGINMLQISGLMIASLLFSLAFLEDVDKSLVLQYIGLMITVNVLIYFLKKSFKLIPSTINN